MVDHQRSRAISQNIDRAMVEAFRVEPAGVVALLDSCRSSLLANARSDAERVEIARRISEAKVSVLYERNNAIDEFAASWEELKACGFASREREASMLIYYIKFSDQVGAMDAERRTALIRLGDLVDEMTSTGEEELATHFRAVCTRLS